MNFPTTPEQTLKHLLGQHLRGRYVLIRPAHANIGEQAVYCASDCDSVGAFDLHSVDEEGQTVILTAEEQLEAEEGCGCDWSERERARKVAAKEFHERMP